VLPSDPHGDDASQWIQHDAERPDKHLPGSACSGSDASDRTGLGIRCRWSLLHPHNSNPRPANAAARLKQQEAATSAAGARNLTPVVLMPLPSSCAGLHQQWGWSIAQ